jgi:hypothetical protein
LPAFDVRLATTTMAQGALSGIVFAGGSEWPNQGWWGLSESPTYVPFDGIVRRGSSVHYPAGYWPAGPILTTVLPYGSSGCSVMPTTVEVVLLPTTQVQQNGPSSEHLITGDDAIFVSGYPLARYPPPPPEFRCRLFSQHLPFLAPRSWFLPLALRMPTSCLAGSIRLPIARAR